jgi:DNA polymerase-3 subunit delta'
MDNLYPWLQPLWTQLQKALTQDRLPNSIMIESTDGLGEQQLIDALGKALLCSNSTDEGCGFCHSCQLFAAGTHPDYHRLMPLETKKQISVDQVRELNRFAAESSQLSGKRVLVVTLAEQMNSSASNALLKTLEEPPSQCVFIVLTHAKSQLLPTVVSRCQQWHVSPPSIEQAQHWIAQQSLSVSDLALTLYAQAPLKLNEFTATQSDELTSLITLLTKDNVLVEQSKIVAILTSEPQRSLEQLSIVLHMALRHFAQPYAGLEAILTPVCNRWDFGTLSRMVERLDNLRAELRAHPGLNTELLLIEWLTYWHE